MKGMTVQIVKKTQTSVDPFGAPIYEEELVNVNDVLVGQPTAEELNNTISLYGKTIAFTLGIPKGDTNDWTDAEVVIWGERYRTIGYPETGIQENIPLRWGKNVKVERYG